MSRRTLKSLEALSSLCQRYQRRLCARNESITTIFARPSPFKRQTMSEFLSYNSRSTTRWPRPPPRCCACARRWRRAQSALGVLDRRRTLVAARRPAAAGQAARRHSADPARARDHPTFSSRRAARGRRSVVGGRRLSVRGARRRVLPCHCALGAKRRAAPTRAGAHVHRAQMATTHTTLDSERAARAELRAAIAAHNARRVAHIVRHYKGEKLPFFAGC